MNAQTQSAYDQLARQWLDGQVPITPESCAECIQGSAIPFNVLSDEEPHIVDEALGNTADTVTPAWIILNPWISAARQETFFRNTFLFRVLAELERIVDLKTYAEIAAYIGEREMQFFAIEDGVEQRTWVTPRFMIEVFKAKFVGENTSPIYQMRLNDNFVFWGDRIYYSSFTNTKCQKAEPIHFNNFLWQYQDQCNVAQAAWKLKQNYELSKERHERLQAFLNRLSGLLDVGLAVALFIPVAGEVVVVGRGGMAALRVAKYAFYGLEAFVAGTLIADGSVKLFLGEDWKLGEKLFISLAEVAGAQDPETRGKQVFLLANLALLLPVAGSATKWVLTKIPGTRRTVLAYEMSYLLEQGMAQATRRMTAAEGELLALRLRTFRVARSEDTANVLITHTPSFDTAGAWFIDILPDVWKASVHFKAPTPVAFISHLMHNNLSDILILRRFTKGICAIGEEAVVVRQFLPIPGARVLGYERGIVGLTASASGHGIDALVIIPKGTTLTLRVPRTKAERYQLDGTTRNTVQTVTRTYEQDTLVVVEVKTTLGTTRTPELIEATQATGTADVERILANIEKGLSGRGAGGWTSQNMRTIDPYFEEKVNILQEAFFRGNIEYVQAGVFLYPNGTLRQIILNTW